MDKKALPVEALENPYEEIAGHLPNEVGVGGALITMVEPDLGFEHAYNRWYEDDHFYAGAMVGPWMFSGRRWVATRDLQSLRFPKDSPVAQPVTAGAYISTYWITAGHFDDAERWGQVAMSKHLYPNGRGFDHRQHVYTAFSNYDFGAARPDLTRLRPEHALDHPFAGMVVEVIEPDAKTDRGKLLAALRDQVIPAALTMPLALAMAFTSKPMQSIGPMPPRVGQPFGVGRALTLLWFVQADPRACWSLFRTHTEAIARVGGKLVFAAPFVPTIVGTDTYVDELR
jgi:hypothetical protein